jgi:hypothetical protein
MKVFIYGLCDVFYDSFYIQGISEVCKNYSFNISKFPDFRQRTFAAIVEYNNIQKKIIIDSNDGSFYDEKALEWCDVYGKVNYNFKDILCEKNSKIIAIGPSFGIKIWNFFQTISIGDLIFYVFTTELITNVNMLQTIFDNIKGYH